MPNLVISPQKAALTRRIKQPFSGVYGTPPYTYSLVSGIGSIDASSGLYTAPDDSFGSAVVRVTDAAAMTFDASIMIGNVLQLIADIIQTELDLDDGRVWIFDQKIKEPTDEDAFVVIHSINPKPFGNSTKYESTDDGMQQVQSVNMSDMIQIDIKSRNLDALNRKEEIILALNSMYSQNQQALNNFSIGIISKNFINLSNQDGAAIPYRYIITCQVQYMILKKQSAAYYDDFSEPEIITDP